MIITLKQIAESLKISKQAVAKYVNRGLIERDKNNKIDLDNPVNYSFLESKGADFGAFGIELIQKAIKTPLKPEKTEQNSFESETTSHNHVKSAGNISQKLDLQIKLQTLKAKEADTHLKKIKIEELQGKLIPRDLAERYIADTIGAFSQSLISLPFAVVDNIFSIMTESPKKREDLITLLQEKYTKEMSKAAERGYKKFKRDMKERIQEQEQLERNGSEQDR